LRRSCNGGTTIVVAVAATAGRTAAEIAGTTAGTAVGSSARKIVRFTAARAAS
jgi:hypothetical protein